MTVAVGGQQVLSATPEAWNSSSTPVQLTAGQPVALRVETAIESSGFPRGALHAMLFWQGPGVSAGVVPREALSLPDADTRGLKGTYRFKDGQEEKVVTQTDSAIDFAWTVGGLVVSGDAAKNQAASELADLMWNRFSAVDLLDALEQSGELHPLLEAAESGAGNLRTSQRKAFLQILLSRPSLLEPLEPMKFLWLYRAFRIGAIEESLEVFGEWAGQRTDWASEMPDYVALAAIDNEMRKACRQLAICVTQEVPEQRLRLRDEYLEQEDGRCCLPVAYTLGYSYQSTGEMDEWIELLDGRLEGQTLSGDKRVNWLIARAHAEEIRLGTTDSYANPAARLLAGRGWLDEALLMAQTPEVKARVAKEVAARLAAMEEFDEARQVLAAVRGGAPAALAAQIDDWKKSVDWYEGLHAKHRDRQAAEAQASYVETLQKRRDAATARGDSQAAARYAALIEAASNQ